MSADNVKPLYNAKRRIQLLFGFVIVLIVAACAGWYFIAGKIDVFADRFVQQQAQVGNNIKCAEQTINGFPFRFGVFCSAIEIDNVPQGFVFNAGAVRSAAQFYAPRDLIVELDGPAYFEQAGFEAWNVVWSQMRARIVATEPVPKNISIISKDVILGQDGQTFHAMAAGLEAYSRIVHHDIDIAGRVVGLNFDGLNVQVDSLPPLDADFDIRLLNGAIKLYSKELKVRGSSGTLNRLAILLNEDRGLLVDGKFAVDQQGLIDASLKLRVVDVDGVLPVLVRALPNAEGLLTAFFNGQKRTGANEDEIELNIDINKSQARLGIIPLGTIPPL